MNKFQHSACNDVLGAPPGASIHECGALPIHRGVMGNVPIVQSFWKSDPVELEHLNKGRAVVLTIHGHTHPPLRMGVAATE